MYYPINEGHAMKITDFLLKDVSLMYLFKI